MSIQEDIDKLKNENIKDTDIDLTEQGYNDAEKNLKRKGKKVNSYNIKEEVMYNETL